MQHMICIYFDILKQFASYKYAYDGLLIYKYLLVLCLLYPVYTITFSARHGKFLGTVRQCKWCGPFKNPKIFAVPSITKTVCLGTPKCRAVPCRAVPCLFWNKCKRFAVPCLLQKSNCACSSGLVPGIVNTLYE